MPDNVREPLVTVIVPAFNAEAYLAAAVKSALDQTLRDLEVIIVDDASTDSTLEVARALAAADDRVRVLSNLERLGPAGGRNKALAHARGHWIALLDADDLFAPNRLQLLTSEAERRGLDFIADNLVLNDVEQTSEALAFAPSTLERHPLLNLVDLVRLDAFPPGSSRAIGFCKPVFARAFVEAHALHYDLRAFRGQDFVFYFRAIELGARFGLTPEALYEFKVGHGSHSSGLAALGHIAEANGRLLIEGADLPAPVRAALQQRGAKLNFEIFRSHVRNHAPLAALASFFRVEPTFAMRKFWAACRRRVGLSAVFA